VQQQTYGDTVLIEFPDCTAPLKQTNPTIGNRFVLTRCLSLDLSIAIEDPIYRYCEYGTSFV